MKAVTRLGVLLSLFSISALVWFAWRHWNSLPQLSWTPLLAFYFLAAVLIFSLAPLTGAAAWFLLLRGSRERISLRAAVSVYLVSQFAKYVPGNIGHHIGRLVLSKEIGVGIAIAAGTTVVESVLIVLSGCMWVVLWLLSAGTRADNVPALADLPRVLVISALPALIALLGIRMLKRPPKWVRRLLRGREIALPSFRSLAGCLGLTTLAFLFTGISTRTIASALTDASEISLMHFSGLFALVWISGFATPGAPAGAGIREAILLFGLRPDFGAPMALTITLILRAVNVASDALLFVIGLALRRTAPSKGRSGGE